MGFSCNPANPGKDRLELRATVKIREKLAVYTSAAGASGHSGSGDWLER